MWSKCSFHFPTPKSTCKLKKWQRSGKLASAVLARNICTKGSMFQALRQLGVSSRPQIRRCRCRLGCTVSDLKVNRPRNLGFSGIDPELLQAPAHTRSKDATRSYKYYEVPIGATDSTPRNPRHLPSGLCLGPIGNRPSRIQSKVGRCWRSSPGNPKEQPSTRMQGNLGNLLRLCLSFDASPRSRAVSPLSTSINMSLLRMQRMFS